MHKKKRSYWSEHDSASTAVPEQKYVKYTSDSATSGIINSCMVAWATCDGTTMLFHLVQIDKDDNAFSKKAAEDMGKILKENCDDTLPTVYWAGDKWSSVEGYPVITWLTDNVGWGNWKGDCTGACVKVAAGATSMTCESKGDGICPTST
eukprot:1332198-Amorphochlora_amoeboformis.AAC.1